MLHLKKYIIAIVMASSMAQAMDIQQQSLSYPGRIGNIVVHHNDIDGFLIKDDKEYTPVQKWNIDKQLRGISTQKLSKMLAAGAYLQINKDLSKEEYSIKLQGKLKGGGPILSSAVYWMVKGFGYALPLAVITKAGAEIIKEIPQVGGESVSQVVKDHTDLVVGAATTEMMESGLGGCIKLPCPAGYREIPGIPFGGIPNNIPYNQCYDAWMAERSIGSMIDQPAQILGPVIKQGWEGGQYTGGIVGGVLANQVVEHNGAEDSIAKGAIVAVNTGAKTYLAAVEAAAAWAAAIVLTWPTP